MLSYSISRCQNGVVFLRGVFVGMVQLENKRTRKHVQGALGGDSKGSQKDNHMFLGIPYFATYPFVGTKDTTRKQTTV